MSIIYVHQFHIDLLGLNEDLYHVYIDSHVETGGGRETVFLRQHERGIPLTLRENFSKNGSLTSSTEQRDIIKVENEFQVIGQGKRSYYRKCRLKTPIARYTSSVSH